MASSEERSSRAYDLSEDVDKKLAQVRGICGSMLSVPGVDEPVAEALSAAEDLIEYAQKAFKELRHIYHEYEYPTKAPEGGAQSITPKKGGSTTPSGVTLGVTTETHAAERLVHPCVTVAIRERPRRHIGISWHPTESTSPRNAGFFMSAASESVL